MLVFGISLCYNIYICDTYRVKEIGLYYLQSRYYDAGVCRFLNTDEPTFISLSRSSLQNLFAYCYNYPIDRADYTGFEPITISLAAVLAIAKAVVSIFVLAYVICLITRILTDRGFQRDISTALSKLGAAIKAKVKNVVVAIVAAYVIAKTFIDNNRYEVHHIVAQSSARAAPARKQLKAVGIGIHSSTNKVAIKYNLHKRLHTNNYYDAVNAAIDKAYNGSSSGAKQRVTDTLNAIKNALLSMNASMT